MKPEYILLTPLPLLGVILQFTPLLARPGIFFGATVDPSFPKSNDGRRLLLSYRLQIALWTLVAIGVGILLVPIHPATVVLVTLLLIVGAGFIFWLKFREVHEHYGRSVPNVRYAEISPRREEKSLSLGVCAPPFLWIAGVALYLSAHWSQIPERFPVHWGADGQPNGWSTRSPLGVFGPLALATFIDVFCLVFALALQRMSRDTTMRQVTFTILLLVMYPVSFAFGMVGLLPLMSFPVWIIPAVTLTFVAGVISGRCER